MTRYRVNLAIFHLLCISSHKNCAFICTVNNFIWHCLKYLVGEDKSVRIIMESCACDFRMFTTRRAAPSCELHNHLQADERMRHTKELLTHRRALQQVCNKNESTPEYTFESRTEKYTRLIEAQRDSHVIFEWRSVQVVWMKNLSSRCLNLFTKLPFAFLIEIKRIAAS